MKDFSELLESRHDFKMLSNEKAAIKKLHKECFCEKSHFFSY